MNISSGGAWMRLFTAIPFNDSVKTRLSALCTAPIPSVRWEHPDDFHITLRFIGDVDEATAERYIAALKFIKAAAFDLTLARVGRFPDEPTRTPRVLWAGVNATSGLLALHAAVSAALEASGLPKDPFETYRPHVTLARFKEYQPSEALTQFFVQHAAFITEPIPVTAFVLYQSARTETGGHYQEVLRLPLEGSAR